MECRQPALGLLGGDVGVSRLSTITALAAAGLLSLSACDADAPVDSNSQQDLTPTVSARPTPAPAPTSAPTSGAPEPPRRGACYRLTYDQAIAPTTQDAPRPCRGAHTTQTYAVGDLDLILNGHLLGVDSAAAREQAARRCPARLAKFLGGTQEQLRLSLLRPVWFTPTIEESDAGAGWYRCDVIAIARERRLAPIRGTLKGILATPEGRDEFGMCGTDQPGSASFSRVLCREDHTWRAIAIVGLASKSKDGSYPGEKPLRRAGEEICADAARTIAADALDYDWGYEWPTREQWDAGQTYGRCWAPDPA